MIFRIGGVLIISVIILLVLLQGCFTLRISDKEAQKKYNDKGIKLLTNTIEIGNNKIHYAETGADSLPTLIFIHGSPGSWKDFTSYLEDKELSSKFRLISIDRPGFGYSNFGKSFHLQDQSNIIGDFILKINNQKPVYLIGHSLGGPLVANIAADNPKSIAGILILAGALDPLLEPKEKWRPILGSFPLYYLLPGALRVSNKELWYLKSDLYLLSDKLKLIKTRVLVMHGDKDVLVDVRNVNFIKKEFVNAYEIKDTIFLKENHFLPWARFKEIKYSLMKW